MKDGRSYWVIFQGLGTMMIIAALMACRGVGTGALPGVGVSVTPVSLDFGGQTVGTTSAPKTVTVSNLGELALDISAVDVMPTEFEVSGPPPGTVMPGSSVTYDVTFTPSATETFFGSLTFTIISPDPLPLVSLSGTGVSATTALTVIPSSISFGDQIVNTTSSPRNVLATNSGGATITIGDISTTAPFAVSGFTGSTVLTPGENHTLEVTFTPDALNTFAGTLTITSDAPSSPDTVSLTGRGVSTATRPELPRIFMDTTFVQPTGGTIVVRSGEDFQAALNSANCGDTILLEAGATFPGNFVLPNKGACAGNFIVIRSDAADANLPAEGQRVDPATHASFMPKIVSPSSLPAIRTALGANHYRLMFIEITHSAGVKIFDLVELGTGTESAVNQPHNIFIDRSFIHGIDDTTTDTRRGVSAQGNFIAVIDSHISSIKEAGADTQAVACWSCGGPIKIVNNFLEAAGENVLIGGADPAITDLVPSDIEVRRNHLFKPSKWNLNCTGGPLPSGCDDTYDGSSWTVKNNFELKNARRVLIEGNVFENNWAQAQNGLGILFTVRNQDGGCSWCVVEDVTFRLNKLINLDGGFNIHSQDDIFSSALSKFILIENNLFDKIGNFGNERSFQINNQILPNEGMEDVTINHNTIILSIAAVGPVVIITAGTNKADRFIYKNNISLGFVFAADLGGTGSTALNNSFEANLVFIKNVLVAEVSTDYSDHTDNFFPAVYGAVGFLDFTGGNYRLSASSPHKNAGDDGKDIGADIDAIEAATAGVVTP